MFKTIFKTVIATLFVATLAHANAQQISIATLLGQSDSLNNKVVQVKGQVVKVSKNIMNTDWVHVQDEKGNKVIFRSVFTDVNVGDNVTAKGTVNANVDYGYGYAYKVIVVDSSFQKN